MKLVPFLIFLFAVNLSAQNLAEILDAFKDSKKIQLIKEQTKSEISQNELISSTQAPELGISLSHAEDSADSGLEYSLGFSQTLFQPFAGSSKNRGVEALNRAVKYEEEHQKHILELEVASRYHKACVSKEIRNKANLLYEEQSKRFDQFAKAYDLGEISRKNLLFNQLDLVKLNKAVNNYRTKYLVEFSDLQEIVDNFMIDELSCDDLAEITRVVELKELSEHDEIKTIEFKENSSKAFYNVYDSMLQSLGYEVLYEQELDTQRYTAGITIPFGALSSQNEKIKAQQMNMSSVYAAQKASMHEHIKNASHLLQLKVAALFDEYMLLEIDILPLNEELVKLSKSAYSEGEGTVLEYLDATRSYSENVLEMLEVKKSYYHELFELYKQADLHLGENYAK